MLSKINSIFSLLLAIGILLLGNGLLGTALSMHAGIASFSDLVTGIIMSAFFIGYVIGSYLCPRLISEVGHIRAFAVLAAFGSVSVIMHGLIVDPVVWWFLRIISGIAMVGLYLVVESWLNTLIPSQYRGKIFSVYVAITLLSMGIGQYLILFYGAGTLATYALCAIFFILALVPISITRLTQPAQVAVPELILRRLIKISPLGVAGVLVTGVGNGAFWGLGALYAYNMGYSEIGVAIFMSSVIFGGAFLQVPIGHLSDRYDRRKILMFVSLTSMLLALSIVMLSGHSQTLLMISTVLYGGFSFSVYSLSVAHTNDHIEPHEVMNATRGLLLVNGIGAAIGPILAGIFMQLIGPQGLMIYLAVVFGVLLLFALHRMYISEPVPASEQSDFVPMARTGTAAVEMDPRTD